MHAVLGLVCWLSLSPAPAATPVRPAGAATNAPRGSVELDLGGLEPIDPGVRSELAKAIHAALADVLEDSELPPETVHVAIAWQDPTAVDYAVRIHIDATGDAPPSDLPATTGPDASTAELAEVVAAALDRAMSERARRLVRSSAPVAAVDPDVPPPKPTAPRRRATPRSLRWAGIGLVIAGATGVAVGGGLVGLGTPAIPGDAPRLRDWRPAGYSLVAIGGAALVSGTVLAVVDARRRHAARVSVRPWARARAGGFVARVSF